MTPRTLILRTAGTNCDLETAHAFELAGATTRRVHINQLLRDPGIIDDFHIIAFPGGFSYGDDIAAGRILANQVAQHLRQPLAAFVASGRPIIGICNGFQVLVKTDLLPGPLAGRTGQNCTLTNNESGRFADRWVHLAARSRKCIWTSGLCTGNDQVTKSSNTTDLPDARGVIDLPIAHGEGKFVAADDAVHKALWEQDQVALVYVHADGSAAHGTFPNNPNGSLDDIAGICDSSGLVLGLMPHPERHVDPTQHPAWTSRAMGGGAALDRPGPGLAFFTAAVRHAKGQVAQASPLASLAK